MKLKWQRPHVEHWLESHPRRDVGPVIRPPLSILLDAENPFGGDETEKFYSNSRPPFARFVIEAAEFDTRDGFPAAPTFSIVEYDADTQIAKMEIWINWPRGNFVMVCEGLKLGYADHTNNIDEVPLRASGRSTVPGGPDGLRMHIRAMSKLMLETCAVMACSNVHLDEVPVSKFRAMKRLKKRLPNVSYWVLAVEEHLTLKPNKHGGTHASPRQHIRRGHIRILNRGTGKERGVWVQQSLVSAGSTGRIEKQYQVVR